MIKSIDVILNYASIYSDGLGKPILIKYPEYDDTTLREFEILSYGMYITNHPCSKYKDVIKVENIKNYLFKNINMDNIQKHINNAQKAVNLIQELTSKGTTTQIPKTPRPITKFFGD